MGREFGKELVDFLQEMTGIGPFAIDLASKMALHRDNRSRAFRSKRKNFIRTPVNKLRSQFHREFAD